MKFEGGAGVDNSKLIKGRFTEDNTLLGKWIYADDPDTVFPSQQESVNNGDFVIRVSCRFQNNLSLILIKYT